MRRTTLSVMRSQRAGDLLRSKFDPVSCRRPDYAAGQVVAGAHSGPRIGTGRQNDTGIKFDGLRRFQRDLGDFFEWHPHPPYRLDASTPALIWIKGQP